MSGTHHTHETSSKAIATTGQIVEGLRAKYYDIGNSPLGLPFVTWPHVRLITLQPGQSILDVGCGTGEVLHLLHKKFGDAVSLHGIDPSDDMLAVARHKLRNAPNAQLGLGIGEQLQFPDASFDWVVSSLTFHHVPLGVKRATIRESYRVLKPGGKILISDFGKPTTWAGQAFGSWYADHAFTSDNLKDIVTELILEAGFVDIADTIVAGLIHHTLARK
ncbi:MAG: methyltransferase domain-containing protein [Chloroflexota bacterium]